VRVKDNVGVLMRPRRVESSQWTSKYEEDAGMPPSQHVGDARQRFPVGEKDICREGRGCVRFCKFCVTY
jgi:hypothetical protein